MLQLPNLISELVWEIEKERGFTLEICIKAQVRVMKMRLVPYRKKDVIWSATRVKVSKNKPNHVNVQELVKLNANSKW